MRRTASPTETVDANRRWWDSAADAYQDEHGEFLGDVRFVWGPEGLDEARVGLLGEVAGHRVLEIGCGAGQCGRWLIARGAAAVGVDLSYGQLAHADRIDRRSGVRLAVVQADAGRLPFADGSFDAACSSYGALPFVADVTAVLTEVARVLRPGARFVFSVAHPVRWCFLDEPGDEGLFACQPYFDRRAYVEADDDGVVAYVEHHRTMGDWIRAIRGAGLLVADVVEPDWPDDNDLTWGGWSPRRGRIIPGTAIFVTDKRDGTA
jgi:ubiquinone/menaquinone biosynthesis C-methylase UbiE